jgi:hypothetical protein
MMNVTAGESVYAASAGVVAEVHVNTGKFLFVGAIGLLAGNHLGRFDSASAAEPVAGQTARTPATQAAAPDSASTVNSAKAQCGCRLLKLNGQAMPLSF